MATFTDDFNRADNTNLGAVWDVHTSVANWAIVGNLVRASTTGVNLGENVNAPTFTANQSAQVTIVFLSNLVSCSVGPTVRAAAAARDYYWARVLDTGALHIVRVVAGAETSLSSTAGGAVTAGDVVKISAIGNQLIDYIDGVSTLSTTDSTFTSGRPGLVGHLIGGAVTDIRLDDFSAADIPSVSHRASIAGSGNTTTSVTLVIPATTQADDIVIAAFTNGGATADPSVVDDEGAGVWAKVLSGNNGSSNLSVWWKRASSSTASKTITASGFTNSCTGVASVYSGALTSGNPYGGQTYESNISGNETHAAITPTVDGSMVFLVVGQAPDIAIATQAATSPAVLPERAEHLSTGGADSAVCLSSEVQVTAGSTGSLTWAQTNAATMSIAFYLTPASTATTLTGVGDAAGTSTATAESKATKKAVGAAATTSTVTAEGKATKKAVAAAAGTSTVTADGQSTNKAAGAADGTSTVTAVGESITAGIGAAAGTSTATAVGKSTNKAAASAAGTATVTAVSRSTAKSAAAAAAASTVAAVGLSTNKAVGSAAGTSTAEAAVVDANADAVGTASGTSTAAAIARAFALAGGSSQAISTAAAIAQAINKAAASAAGTSTAEAVGENAGVGLTDGDIVMVLQAGGIECSVYHDTGTLVSVATASAKQISVVQAGGTPIRVTI